MNIELSPSGLPKNLRFFAADRRLQLRFQVSTLSDGHGIKSDQVQVLFCDFDLDVNDPAEEVELISYLSSLRSLLEELLLEEKLWVVYYLVNRLAEASVLSTELEYTN